GSRAMVHALGPRGHRALRRHHGLSPRRVAPKIGYGYLVHEIETRDALIKLQLLIESIPGLEFLLLDELHDLLPPCPKWQRPDEWRVRVPFENGERTVLVKPDAIFAVRDRQAAAGRGLRVACIELDRGSMKIRSRDLAFGSSIARKLVCYAELHHQGPPCCTDRSG
ncbi:MAG TPA: replication-relaxation family protein, partial [Geminicoccaceae bacterium]|nr:replication-relaxation family protein [Geminicoccaceae bacterium]